MRISIDIPMAAAPTLAGHPLAQRWLDAGRDAREPPFDLVRPIWVEDAPHLYAVLRPLVTVDGTTLDPSRFRAVIPLDATGDPAALRHWLHESLPRDTGDLTLSWTPQLSAAVPPDAFFEHWDLFCRAGADDLIVWAADDRWAAFYRRKDERMFVGNRHHRGNE